MSLCVGNALLYVNYCDKANAAGGFTVNGARFHYKWGEGLKDSHT